MRNSSAIGSLPTEDGRTGRAPARRWIRAAKLGALMVACLTAGSLAVAAPASADVVESTAIVTDRVTIPEYGTQTTADHRVILRITVSLRAGQAYYLRGRWTVTSNTSRSTMQGSYLRCYRNGDAPTSGGKSVFTTRNHVPHVSSTNTVETRMAYRAPTSDSYKCELVGYGVRLDVGTGGRHFDTVGGEANTYLFTNDSGFDDLEEWRGDSTATLNDGDDLYVMRRTFTPSGNTNMLRAHADLEATVIRTAPLTDTEWRVTLYVTQLDANGNGCAAPVRTVQKNVRLDPDVVHDKTYLQTDVRIYSPTAYPGCVRRFAIKTRVTHINGLDLRLEGDLYSNSLAWSYIA